MTDDSDAADTSGATDGAARRLRLRLVTDADNATGRETGAGTDTGAGTGAETAGEPVAGPAVDDPAAEVAEDESRDWAWVAEWRGSGEGPPWATGLPLAAFAAVLAGVAVWVLSAGLAGRPVLAIALNVLVAAGLAPAMWLCRGVPVLRWFAAGAAVGVVGGWIAAVVMLSAA